MKESQNTRRLGQDPDQTNYPCSCVQYSRLDICSAELMTFVCVGWKKTCKEVQIFLFFGGGTCQRIMMDLMDMI